MNKEIIEKLEKIQSNLSLCLLHNHEEEQEFMVQALDLLKQQPPAGKFTKEARKVSSNIKEETDKANCLYICTYLDEACDRLDRAEAINKDLVEACENLTGFLETEHLAEILEKEIKSCAKSCATCYLINTGKAAIAKDKKEKKHGGCWPEAKKVGE